MMGITIRLLLFVGAILTPIFAILETKKAVTCGNHMCFSAKTGGANLHYRKLGCFCDALCHIYNDCCQDYKPKTVLEIETQTAKCRSPTKHNDPIMMVISCPASFKGKRSLVDKCQKNSIETISTVPVSGRNKQLVYRNVYCALCNGEHDYTFWNQKLSCFQTKNLKNLTMQEMNYTDCFKSFQNPYPNTSHLCSESLVKNCQNLTVSKCETERNGIVYSTEGIFYKNIHCFQCNKKPDEELICEDLPNGRDLATPLTFTSPSYFILIDFNRRDVHLNGERQLFRCPIGHWFDYINGKCQPALDLERPSTDTHVLNCSLLKLRKHEYTLLPNETLYRNSTKTFFDKDSYMIKNDSDVFICHDSTSKESSLETWLTFLGMGFSLCALAFLIVFYMFMPIIWNLSGMIYISFSASLFVAQIIFLFSRYSTQHDSCLTIAIAMHYAFLASFFWLNIVSLNIWVTVCRNPCETTSWKEWNRFFLYSLYAWLTPLALIVPAVLIDKHRPSSKFAPSYGYNGICWFNSNGGILMFFVIPLACIILINLAAYVHTGVTIYKLRKFSVQNSGKVNIKILIINAKLCLLTGVTWSFGYAASIFDSKELRIIFVILNSTYGLWLAICFLTSENIVSLLKQKFRNNSQSTSTKTMS